MFFRRSCAERARALGVDGWVRNLPDGRVEAAFEGEAESVATMVDWCRVGPRAAEVRDLEVRDQAPEGAAGFQVR